MRLRSFTQSKTLNNGKNISNQNIHLFYPIEGKNEVNTWPIHHKLIKTNQLHTSVYNSVSNQWDCVCFDANSAFVKNRYNVPVPDPFKHAKWDKIDIILMPLLCFDDYGNRIGYGKGFYDRYLRNIKKVYPKILSIGVAFSFQKHHNLPVNNQDFKLDYIITEKGII